DTTEERAFRDGQLHVTNTLPIDRIAYYRDECPEVYRTGPQLATYFYRVNLRALPELADVRVRQALSLAIDRRAIVEHVTRGGQTVAHGMVPPGGEGAPYRTPDLLRFDPEAARALLAEAGFPG
ncbi:MAG: peptide ABC transporter substrate-binding protein, partial [Actinobacteria bacterium]|nr:peptide ABC transporter substrate-binding protein [Actinomycetota bacterium]NIU67803.1 peptide ABC transporter substrate-binding protein [Actinomycetota bacterium]NIW29570.1 peptide ABC transporter substrate-binding protein [Actinomycetota bacterium]